MHQILPDDGLIPTLRRIVEADLHYHLYKNNVVPDRDTVLADFVEKVPGTNGYDPITVAGGDFILDGVAGHRGNLLAPPIDFLPTGSDADEIHGYFITDVTDTFLLGCAHFDVSHIPWVDATPITVWPAFGANSRFSS